MYGKLDGRVDGRELGGEWEGGGIVVGMKNTKADVLWAVLHITNSS